MVERWANAEVCRWWTGEISSGYYEHNSIDATLWSTWYTLRRNMELGTIGSLVEEDFWRLAGA